MKSRALIAAAALALTGAAQADTVTYSFTNPMETTEINQGGNLGLFDSSMGMLTGVSLMFNGANTTSLTLTNTAAQAQTVRVNSTTELYFNSTLAALDALIQSANPVLTLTASTGPEMLASGETRGVGPLTATDSLNWDSQLDGILASFSQAGGGMFGLGCMSLSGTQLLGGGNNVNYTQQTQAQCDASITYTFDAAPQNNVPEPAMPALIGAALLGLWAVRRRNA